MGRKVKTKKKRISLTLTTHDIFRDDGTFAGGGIVNSTKHVDNEMWVEIMDDPVLDRATEEEGVTGRLQLHLGSTRRALRELGTFLLALSYYRPPSPGYYTSFEFTDPDRKPALHLVVHLPVKSGDREHRFRQIHNVATAIIADDGKWYDTTLPALNVNRIGKRQPSRRARR